MPNNKQKTWTKKSIIQSVQNHHKEFLLTQKHSKNFNYSYLEKKDSRLMASVQNKKISWVDLLIMSGLDPSCHIAQINYGKTIEEKKANFKFLVDQYVKEHGIQNLNDKSMENMKINLPDKILSSNSSKICLRGGCTKFQISSRSIYAQGRRLFHGWGLALEFCGIDYEKEVLRRKSNYQIEEVIKSFHSWDKKRHGNWIINDLKKNYALYQQINNSFRNKTRKVPFADFYDDRVFVFWMTLIYFRKTGEISKNRDWWDDNFKRLLKLYEKKHIGQERWSEEKIITGIQQIYSRGPNNSRLSRQSVSLNDLAEDKTLWGAMRQSRFRKAGKYEDDWLKDAGFLQNNLKKLYDELDKPFSLLDCANMFARLLKESNENDENRLTREYCSKNHKEFCNFIVGEYKSWENGLRKFGLDPKFFSISPSKRSKRGLVFQEFFKEMLLDYGFEETKNRIGKLQFSSNKFLKGCKHKIKCKPDFNFGNLIIDTKTGYHVSRNQDQIKRYFHHSGRVIILTLNGKTKTEKIKGNIPVEVMNFRDFLINSKKILGINFDLAEMQALSATLKRSPFWRD